MQDRLVRFLNQYGYQPVFLAETGVQPPELYNFTADRRLIRRGPLRDYLPSGGHDLSLTEGQKPNLEHIETSSKGGSAAISFLKAALAAIGVAGQFGINLRSSRKSELVFAFTGVTYQRLDPSKIDSIVQDVNFGKGIDPSYIAAGRMHIVYEYLYSRTLLMRKADQSAFGADIAASPTDIIEGEVNVEVALENETTIRFEAAGGPAAFAYKAGRLEQQGEQFYFYPEEVVFLPDRTRRRELERGAAPGGMRYVYSKEMEPLLAAMAGERSIVRVPFIPAEGVVLTAESEPRSGSASGARVRRAGARAKAWRLEEAIERKNEISSRFLFRKIPLEALSAVTVGARRYTEVEAVQPTVAVGVAVSDASYRIAVRIQSRADGESGPDAGVSDLVEEIREAAQGEVDVRFIGEVRASARRSGPWHRTMNRPLLIGGSVGHYAITAGTLGCFVRSRKGGSPMILSNNHVLADENRAKKRDVILQQAHADGGRRPKNVMATLTDFVQLNSGGTNRVDAAVATVKRGIKIDVSTLKGLGRLAGVATAPAAPAARVAKVGRTTGSSRGRITAIEVDNLVVEFETGNYRFDGQIEIEGEGEEPFSKGGDSGSLIVDAEQWRALALLFAGNTQGGSNGRGLTYAAPIQEVLDALNVELLY